MISDPIPTKQLTLPETVKSEGSWTPFWYGGGGRFLRLNAEIIGQKTVLEIVNGPYVLRFDLSKQVRVYFIGLNDYLYWRLTGEGKTVRWLHELFQEIQNQLTRREKLKQGQLIFAWPLKTLWFALGSRDNSTTITEAVQLCKEVLGAREVTQ